MQRLDGGPDLLRRGHPGRKNGCSTHCRTFPSGRAASPRRHGGRRALSHYYQGKRGASYLKFSLNVSEKEGKFCSRYRESKKGRERYASAQQNQIFKRN